MSKKFHSQFGQDEFVNSILNKTNGLFVDVGAHDGVTFNNTLFFERELKWSGINIEPIEEVFNKLVINRPDSININVAAGQNESYEKFLHNKGYTEMLSGLMTGYTNKHLTRLENELSIFGGESNIITVQVRTLKNIFNDYNIKHVDYLTIDVEGSEEDVIRGIDFDNVTIDIIGFENNEPERSKPIIQYLETLNYKVIKYGSDIFMRK